MNDFLVIGGWVFGLFALVASVLFISRDTRPNSKKS